MKHLLSCVLNYSVSRTTMIRMGLRLIPDLEDDQFERFIGARHWSEGERRLWFRIRRSSRMVTYDFMLTNAMTSTSLTMLKSLGHAQRLGQAAWLAVPSSQREEVEGDFLATIEEAKDRGFGHAQTRLLIGLVVARYSVVVAWFVVYRVTKLLPLLTKLIG